MELYNKKLYQYSEWQRKTEYDSDIIQNRNNFTLKYQPIAEVKAATYLTNLYVRGFARKELYECVNGFILISSPSAYELSADEDQKKLNWLLKAGWTVGEPLYSKGHTTLYKFIENKIHLYNFALVNRCSVFDLNCYFTYEIESNSVVAYDKESFSVIGTLNKAVTKLTLNDDECSDHPFHIKYEGSFYINRSKTRSLKLTPRETIILKENIIKPAVISAKHARSDTEWKLLGSNSKYPFEDIDEDIQI